MREIKFRAWWQPKDGRSKHQHKMVYDIQREYDGSIFICDCFNDYMQASEFTVMQYTGLKDKNGKEIYEGDIVKETYENGDTMNYGEIENMMLWYRNTTNAQLRRMEIIGNIYENPGML